MAPLRRSQRIATRKTYEGIESEPEDDYSENYKGKGPIKKKPRVKKIDQESDNIIQAAPKRRRLHGLLQKMAETPLDVLFEIFSNLDPVDLLRLSRTSKDLRVLLLQRSSAFVWKRARGNVQGLPPLPDDLSEPKFAHLAFDKHCTNCLRPTKFVQWESRTKYCRQCLEASDLFLTIFDGYSLFRTFVPSFQFTCTSGRRGYYCYFFVPAVETLREESKSFIEDKCKLAVWKMEKETAFRELRSHARQCEIWTERRAQDRTDELATARSERFKGVIERLTALGWDQEVKNLDFIDELRSHKLVWQPRALTERAWSNMSDVVITLAKQHKSARLRDEMTRAVEERARSFSAAYSDVTRDEPLLPIFPKPVDVVILEPFSTLFFDTPLNLSITDSLQAMWIHLPGVVSQWREAQTSELREVMKKAGLKPNINVATTIFTCTNCSEICQYPYILAHRCALWQPYENFNPEDWKAYALRCIPFGVAWSASQFTVNEESVKKVEYLVKTCGLDPETATHEDMDALDCRVICNHCSNGDPGGGQYVMRWQNAACHSGYPTANENAWTLLENAKDIKEVKSLEKSEKERWYRCYSSEKFVCSHCHVLRSRGRDLENHLLEAHLISEISADDWEWSVNIRHGPSRRGVGPLHLTSEEKSDGQVGSDGTKVVEEVKEEPVNYGEVSSDVTT
ncbi:uncharacterized protein BT62DRAFT_274271 [Guyanagaster necrorhizus]|uniref:F-box domain-containing protein n=1 Tax=Guyanagaster necrorhizus TaxID=856835 RepID=A0A9P7W3I9_9AGAR|nr:uncharacterized protein BT62DRAFT_274271 [Guyanagaster necrorhizus MCA 3950]KAG7451982.1 hypothetical protein BT62DRAFT_274271 [Guyanagaster necrorhizus MCA 3950]